MRCESHRYSRRAPHSQGGSRCGGYVISPLPVSPSSLPEAYFWITAGTATWERGLSQLTNKKCRPHPSGQRSAERMVTAWRDESHRAIRDAGRSRRCTAAYGLQLGSVFGSQDATGPCPTSTAAGWPPVSTCRVQRAYACAETTTPAAIINPATNCLSIVRLLVIGPAVWGASNTLSLGLSPTATDSRRGNPRFFRKFSACYSPPPTPARDTTTTATVSRFPAATCAANDAPGTAQDATSTQPPKTVRRFP